MAPHVGAEPGGSGMSDPCLGAPSPKALDCKISALYAAARSSRRSSVCRPFPDDLMASTPDTRDFQALLEMLNELPRSHLISPILSEPGSNILLVELLHWLLDHPRCPASNLVPTSPMSLSRRFPQLSKGFAEAQQNPSLVPDEAFVIKGQQLDLSEGRVYAFHGSTFDALHSILHNGLLPQSGTPLQRHGTLYGDGTYFTTSLATALAFAPQSRGWPQSGLSASCSCVLLCSFPPSHVLSTTGTKLPEKYLVVPRSDAVAVQAVLLYAHGPQFEHQASVCWTWRDVLLCALAVYAAVVMLNAMLSL